jgi:diaminohydroxyphosphoribosylaminopyrimidine deaminase / 5-amino-6-(5-phosphoribosylamino)uracil reductase
VSADERYMQLALDLAAKALGQTMPNPLVGAVVVKDGEIVGSGYHQRAGGPHAEVFALDAAGEAAWGATLYVTLEPCSHTGRTPPCTEKIIGAGIKNVVVAMRDPNPRVNGRGLACLQQNGIGLKTGILEEKSRRLNEVYVKYITTGNPFVTLKAAMTLDGKIATRSGASRWISNEKSREFVHRLRRMNDAVLIGVGTVLADNPAITARLPEAGRTPLRIVVDSQARTPVSARLVAEQPEKTLLVASSAADTTRILRLRDVGVEVLMLEPTPEGRVPLDRLMHALGRREISSVLVEGGGTINYALLRGGLVDKLHFFIAPLIFGGEQAISPVGGEGVARVEEAWRVKDMEVNHYDGDLLVTGYPKAPDREEEEGYVYGNY